MAQADEQVPLSQFPRLTTPEKIRSLVQSGICADEDEAVHFLADAGEIDYTDHYDYLSEKERARVYD